MTTGWLALILGTLAAVCAGFVWVAITLSRLQGGGPRGKKSVADLNKAYTDIAEEDANHLFNKEFREELRNRGRLRFEQIIDENAMFLKQDLDMTISQINDYMKQQISAKLDSEFAAYAKAMKEAQELALASLQRTAADIEAQHNALAQAMQQEVTEREAALLKVYEENMAKVVEHYVLQALGDQLDLKSQLPYIVAQMEANKQAIAEDMRL
ncbi:MAG TPA: hypothetical protein VLF69_05950 [Candidatus Saccharimonadales bacterium]|nr:hypothetical protein [Candidatus Saccharimonadales bacterium]